jgi:glycosyltransferase involved in cell wall biosynthesis
MTKTNAWELLVLPETGLAVDIDDESALVDAMVSVMENYEKYDPEEIRRSCVDRFSDRAVAMRLTEIYEQVLRRGK